MNNITGINTKIKHFSKIFKDNRTYEVFKSIIMWILCLKDWKQWDLANVWWKTLSQIQYFFYKSNWSYSLLNTFRVEWIRNKVWWCIDKKWDVLILDATIMAKNNKSNFSGLANWFFSNRDKKVVNWLEVFWASIYTQSWIKYMLDLAIFYKKQILNSKDKRKWSLMNELWRKFIIKMVWKTKAWLIVLDSGFKWADTCKWIYQVAKRHFLVRISQTQKFFTKSWDEFKIEQLLKDNTASVFGNWKMWVFKDVLLKSWSKKWFNIYITIIVYKVNWAKNPVVLATSADLEDVYENMIRKLWDPSWKEKIKQKDENNSKTLSFWWVENEIYGCFVILYRKRWSIEECFKELKSYLCFETFKVTSYESIMKYFHIVLLVHTLLTIMVYRLYLNDNSFNYIYEFLKEKRNMKKKKWDNLKQVTLIWLKLFIEMIFQTWWVCKIKGKHKKTLAELTKTSICVRSCLSLS